MSSAKVLPVRGEGGHGSGADSVLESGESRAARASEVRAPQGREKRGERPSSSPTSASSKFCRL